jgi:lambda family phage portal protein
MYAAARRSRLTSSWGMQNGSADSELATSLTNLRTRSRQLVRDAGYAKRAKVIVVNNVVGSGIGLQAQVKNTRGELHEQRNDAIEEAFCEWSKADSCHTGGGLHFADLERMVMGQVFEAGEAFIRLHFKKFGNSEIPLALEVIEAERLADEYAAPGVGMPAGVVRMGVEVDEFHRPIAYWIRNRHPGELRTNAPEVDRYERVPADQIIHLRIIDRWPQVRGEPWLHAAAGKLDDMNGYSEAEIIAARGAANYMGVIESPEGNNPLGTEEGEDGGLDVAMEPGIIQKLAAGEKLNFINPGRPNPNMDPFMRAMLREVASAIGVSYESLSRDYSQSNYSSSRLALLDDRDLWRVLQQWWLRSFRRPLHAVFIRQAVYQRAIAGLRIEEYVADPCRQECAKFKLRGWTWVDPTREVAAYKEAVMAGFTTVSDVIDATAGGLDIEDIIETRARELEMFDEAGIDLDTTVPEPLTADSPEDGMQPVPGAPDDGVNEQPDTPPEAGAAGDGADSAAPAPAAARAVVQPIKARA